MELHPVIVHFPVVLLTIYAVLEILTTFIHKHNPNLNWVKKWSLRLGVIGIWAAFATADQAEAIIGRSSLVSIHSDLAGATEAIFLVISALYIVSDAWVIAQIPSRFINPLTALAGWCKRYYITLVLAILGLVVLTATGAVGGSITRGTSHDPIAARAVQIMNTIAPRPHYGSGMRRGGSGAAINALSGAGVTGVNQPMIPADGTPVPGENTSPAVQNDQSDSSY